MKKTVLVIAVAAAVIMTLDGCKRNYQVNYARVAVDTLRQNNLDTIEGEENPVGIYDEPLYEIPDVPGEVSVGQIRSHKSREAGQDAERMFSGEDIGQE